MMWVIVTGDSGGLGNEVTRSLLESNKYGVIGISRTENENIKKLQVEFHDNFIHINFDLSNPNNIKELYLNKIKSIGSIYGLVNNSAYAYDDLVTNINIDSLQEMININLVSTMILTKYAIRDMLLNGVKGSLIHISSVCAHTGYKGLSMYAATKGGIEAFSKSIAREWGKVGIRTNCIAPGFMETKMSKSLDVEKKKKIYKRTSLKKPTSLMTVANTVKFLLSEEASSITGTVIHVDCGTI